MEHGHNMAGCAIAGILFALAGCGTPGAPLPPSLQLPQRVNDLHADRVGDQLEIRFRLPDETLDHQRLKRVGAIALRACSDAQAKACTTFRRVPVGAMKPGDVVALTTDLPPKTYLAAFIFNDRERTAGASNVVFVPLGAGAPDAQSVTARVTADAVVLAISGGNASGGNAIYRVMRSQPGKKHPEKIGEVPVGGGGFRDRNFEWQQQYAYAVHTINYAAAPDGSRVEFESGPPVSAVVMTRDIFPPKAPTGLVAVFTPSAGGKLAIDLNWNANEERDLAGYNVYRAVGAGGFARMNGEPVKSPTFRDAAIQSGMSYRYAVSAIDLRGNESAQSEVATEAVPQQP